MKKRIVNILASVVLLLLAVLGGLEAYRLLIKSAAMKGSGEVAYLYVAEGCTVEQWADLLEEYYAISSKSTLLRHAKWMKFTAPKVGRYKLNPAESNSSLIRKFRSGLQEPLTVTFNNIRTPQELAGRLAGQLMIDSSAIATLLFDREFLKEYGLIPETAVALFIPNSYEMFWTISAKGLFDRMHREYNAFWNSERLKKAGAVGLSPVEVAIVASIVEEETNLLVEYPIVAGLYLNRLRIGMRLQADPTVKFAWGDFGLRRILFKHLEIDSPYNTYKYAGLPPGPIRVPSAAAMNAVLNRAQHNYLYMCAKETLNGEHNFAGTLAEHNRNAAKYQQALNRLNIR